MSEFWGGLLLLDGLVLVGQGRLPAMIALYRLNSVILTGAAFWAGYERPGGGLVLAGLVTLGLGVVWLPMRLRRLAARMGAEALPAGVWMLAAAGLVVLAVLVMPAAGRGLALPLAVVLVGLLVVCGRRPVLARVVGFLVAGNGLVLGAVVLPGVPDVAVLALALALPAGVLLPGLFAVDAGQGK